MQHRLPHRAGLWWTLRTACLLASLPQWPNGQSLALSLSLSLSLSLPLFLPLAETVRSHAVFSLAWVPSSRKCTRSRCKRGPYGLRSESNVVTMLTPTCVFATVLRCDPNAKTPFTPTPSTFPGLLAVSCTRRMIGRRSRSLGPIGRRELGLRGEPTP